MVRVETSDDKKLLMTKLDLIYTFLLFKLILLTIITRGEKFRLHITFTTFSCFLVIFLISVGIPTYGFLGGRFLGNQGYHLAGTFCLGSQVFVFTILPWADRLSVNYK